MRRSLVRPRSSPDRLPQAECSQISRTVSSIPWSLSPPQTATSSPRPLRIDLADRLLLARLSLSPSNMNDDPETATVLASLPENQTAFEYLGSCWRRERAERFKVVAKKVSLRACPHLEQTL